MPRNHQWLDPDVESVLGDYVHRVVNLAAFASDHSADVILQQLVSNILRYSVRAYHTCNPELYLDMHLGEISVKFVLHYLVVPTDELLFVLCNRLAYDLERPRVTRGPNGKPALGLPLVSLLACRCPCYCSLCHDNDLFSGATPYAGRPTCPQYLNQSPVGGLRV